MLDFQEQAACIILSKVCALEPQLEERLSTFRDLKQVSKLKATLNPSKKKNKAIYM